MSLSNGGASGRITITHYSGEHCVVLGSLLQPLDRTPLLKIPPGSNVDKNAVLDFTFEITVLRPPANGLLETFDVKGEWHAIKKNDSGADEADCDGHGDIWAHVTVTALIPLQIGGISIGQQPNATTVGDPVSTSTGEVQADTNDLFAGGPLPIAFQRRYGSALATSSVRSALGPNWMHNFDDVLVVNGSIAAVFLYPGRVVRFQQVGAGWQVAGVERHNYQLIASGGGFQFLDLPTGLIYTFSSAGALTAIRDRNGNTISVTQGTAGPVSVSDGLGRMLTFTYVGDQLNAVSDQNGRHINFQYADNYLTAATDALARTTKYAYAAPPAPDALLISTIMPAGNTPSTQSFDAKGRVVQQADSGGNPTAIDFDRPATGMRQITDAVGRVETHTYDVSGNLVEYLDAAGKRAMFAYDSKSRLISNVDRLGNTTSIAYDATSGFPASVTDALGNVTTFSYAAQTQGPFTFFNLTKITFADRTAVTFTYDAQGDVLTASDQAGKITTYTYNSRGQVLSITNSVGGLTTANYNSDGTVASVKSPVGDVTTYTYDAQKRPVKVIFADNTSRSFVWDAMDHLLSMTDERGKMSRLTYDANDNLQSVTDALNQSTYYGYDTDDLRTSVTDELGRTSRVAYDALGSITASTNANGERTAFAYDNLSRLRSIADPTGNGPSFSYDAEGRLATANDALANTTSFDTDQLGRTTRITTPLGEKAGLTYDGLGRLTSATDPLLRQTAYGYDSRGLLTSVTAPGGIGTAYTRDALGSITKVTDPNGGAWTASYDSMGRVNSWTDPIGHTIALGYDARNRVSSLTSPEGSAALTYDAAGNLIRTRYTDGTDLQFTYDDNSRITGANGVQLAYDAAGRIVRSNGLTVTRDAIGRITSIGYPQGLVTYSYDARGLVSAVSDWLGGRVTLNYNAAGDLVSLGRSNGVTGRFTYDADRRLAGIVDSIGDTTLLEITLSRDSAGQIVSADRNLPQAPDAGPSGTLPLGYDAAHQVTGATYDQLGRMTGSLGRKYVWDLESRLTSYSGADGAASFTYDGFGQRIARTAPDGTTQNYVLNFATALPSVAAVKSGATDLRYYVYLPDGSLLYSIEAGDNSRHFFSFDETGSTAMLTADDGSITDAYSISPYGETVVHRGASDNPFTFQGRWGVAQEPVLGLYYMRFRWYDGVAARFLSRDPLNSVDPRDINPYQYAAGNPMSYTDPLGLKKEPPANGPRQPEPSSLSAPCDQALVHIGAAFGSNLLGGSAMFPNNTNPLTGEPFRPIPGTRWTWAVVGGQSRYVPTREYTDEDTVKLLDNGLAKLRDGTSALVFDSRDSRDYKNIRLNLFDNQYDVFESDRPGLPRKKQYIYYSFRGHTMSAPELNYYHQGVCWSDYPKPVLTAAIWWWNMKRYNRKPAENQLFAADQGYKDANQRNAANVRFLAEVVNAASSSSSTSLRGKAGLTVLKIVLGVAEWWYR
jgi:RHS repeat-associated protein